MWLFYKYFIKVEEKETNEEAEESLLESMMRSPRTGFSTIVKVIAFVVLTIGYFAIGYSRFILGVHSAN